MEVLAACDRLKVKYAGDRKKVRHLKNLIALCSEIYRVFLFNINIKGVIIFRYIVVPYRVALAKNAGRWIYVAVANCVL